MLGTLAINHGIILLAKDCTFVKLFIQGEYISEDLKWKREVKKTGLEITLSHHKEGGYNSGRNPALLQMPIFLQNNWWGRKVFPSSTYNKGQLLLLHWRPEILIIQTLLWESLSHAWQYPWIKYKKVIKFNNNLRKTNYVSWAHHLRFKLIWMYVLWWLKDKHLPYSTLGLTIVDKKDEEVWIDSTVGEKKTGENQKIQI